MLDAEASEAALQHVAIGEADRGVVTCGAVERQHVDLVGAAAGTAALVVTGVDEQPPEPRLEAVGVAQLGQLPPRADEALLDRVVGAVHVTQDAVRQGVEPVERRRGERLIGISIPLSGLLHELSLHRAILRLAAWTAPFTGYDARDPTDPPFFPRPCASRGRSAGQGTVTLGRGRVRT